MHRSLLILAVLTSGATLEAGERTERAALWLSAATDVAATKYGQVACEKDPYCHSVGEKGWLGRLAGVDDSATGWKPLLVKAGTTLAIDLTARELKLDGNKLDARADARAVTACSMEDWEAVQKLRRSARSSRAWSKRLRVGGAILWGGAAAWALYQAR